jgi:3D-(3,5/4)-trihydroxycyclohexane-1,2-dione acylhydrolase (decyclizing)
MGYEIAGAWGARMARREGEVIAFVGDGSYLMLNSELYSSVLSGHKFTTVLCDNGGFAVIHRLQVGQGGVAYNNMFGSSRTVRDVRVDWVAHARSLGARAEQVTLAELPAALARARAADVSTVLVVRTDPDTWTGGDAWWEVGVPEVSTRAEIHAARERFEAGKTRQRLGF